MEVKFIWFDGAFIPFKKAKIHLLNHSLHYGSAVFEGIRCYETEKGPAVFRLKDHVSRFFHSAEVMGMKIPYSRKKLTGAVKNLINKNKLKECYIRPIAFYGEKMGLLPIGAPLSVAIAVWPWGKYLEKESVAVKISPFQRIHPKSSEMTTKISGHYYNSIIAALDAKKSGFDEALLLDWKGNIAEGPGENIFFIKEKKIFTPRAGSILPGITRDSVIKIAKNLGFQVIEKNICPGEIRRFDEAFFTGTAVEVNAIGRINKVIIRNGKPGQITNKIKEKYNDAIRGKIAKYKKWLDYVK